MFLRNGTFSTSQVWSPALRSLQPLSFSPRGDSLVIAAEQNLWNL